MDNSNSECTPIQADLNNSEDNVSHLVYKRGRLKEPPSICPKCGQERIVEHFDNPEKSIRKEPYVNYICQYCGEEFFTTKRRDMRQKRARERVIEIVGGAICVCNDPRCSHGNEVCGFDDIRGVDLDHILGEAYSYRFGKDFQKKPLREIYEFYANHEDLAKNDLRVLCACCNRIKVIINQERSKEMKMRVKAKLDAQSMS